MWFQKADMNRFSEKSLKNNSPSSSFWRTASPPISLVSLNNEVLFSSSRSVTVQMKTKKPRSTRRSCKSKKSRRKRRRNTKRGRSTNEWRCTTAPAKPFVPACFSPTLLPYPPITRTNPPCLRSRRRCRFTPRRTTTLPSPQKSS